VSGTVGIQTGVHYQRREDMSPEGCLRVFVQEDGDVIVSIFEPDRDGRLTAAAVEFCAPGAGGGMSPRTRLALMELAKAIAQDNESKPFPRSS